MSIRYVDNDLEINNIFLGLYSISETSAENIYNMLKDTMIRYQLGLNNCRVKSYRKSTLFL